MSKERDNKELYVPAVFDLREDYIIHDAAHYADNFQKVFFQWIRGKKKLSKTDVAKQTGISVKELERIEEGNVSERDMQVLKRLSDFYQLSYPSLLSLFELVKKMRPFSDVKLAAYHSVDVDEATQKQFAEFIMNLKRAKS